MHQHTVWYVIESDEPEFKYLTTPMVFATNLTKRDADTVALSLAQELKYIIGESLPVRTWVE